LALRLHLHRPAPIVLAILLAVAAPARLLAAVTLTLKGLPAMIQSGTSLPVQVEVQGAEPGKTVTVTAWVRDQEIFRLDKVLPGPRDLAFSIPVPGLSGGSTLVVQARCEGAWSAPRVIQVFPSPGDPDAAPSGSKRSRLPAHPGSASAAAAAAGGGDLHSLSALPQALKVHVGRFTGDLRYVDKSLNAAAQEATAHLTISGPTNDADLLKLLQNHRWIRFITFGDTPDLSPRGIIEALKACTRLVQLVNNGNKLKFTHILELAQTHDSLVNLIIGAREDIRDEEIAALPERMQCLRFRSTTVRDETLSRFQDLRLLNLTEGARLKGDRLPPGMMYLTLSNCRGFIGKDLPTGLRTLIIINAPAFEGPILLPRMVDLRIKGCPGMTSARLLEAVKGAPLLTHLWTDVADRDLIGALPDGMIVLSFSHARGVPDGAFVRFTCLENLELADFQDFTSAHLPPSLRRLVVARCPKFQSELLGTVPLTSLVSLDCREFTSMGLPGSLTDLSVVNCPKVTLPAMMTTLGHLARLQHLKFTGWMNLEADPALFLAHPTLRQVEYSRVPGALLIVWRRPGPPPGAPAAARPRAAEPPPAAAAAAGP
jgi:hypothetical protein